MRKLLLSAVVPLLVILAACQSLGLPTAKTFNERIAVAYGSVTAVRDTATTLVVARKISGQDALNVQKQADTAREGIDLARSVQATNPGEAETKLVAATAILTVLQNYLGSKK